VAPPAPSLSFLGLEGGFVLSQDGHFSQLEAFRRQTYFSVKHHLLTGSLLKKPINWDMRFVEAGNLPGLKLDG
jgi:hypothetical protein